jgi:hypothetical protein
MAETVAASSPAEVDVFRGEQPSLHEYSTYRQTGELPARLKPAEPAESAPADTPEQTVVATEGDEPESVPDSDPDEAQEQPAKGSGAEKRIKQLLAEKKELQRRLDAAAKPDVKTESSTAQQQSPQYAHAKPTADDKKPDGSPKYNDWDEYNEALIDWKAEQKIAQYKQEQVEQEARKALKVKLDDARSRYDDADDVIFPAAQTIHDAQIPLAVKEVFAQSDLFPDLCYVVGSDPEELQKFISLAQTNPRAALAKVFEYERGIKEELAKAGTTVAEPDSGKAPEPKRTNAPKPPSPVGGTSSRGFDVNDESISPDEWMRQMNERVARKSRG